MAKWLAAVCVLLSTLVTPFCSTVEIRGEENGDYERLIKIFQRFADQVNSNCERYFDEEICQQLDIRRPPENHSPFESCEQCMVLMTITIGLVNQNLTLDDMYQQLFNVCVELTPDGYDGEEMCPGIIDNYGPHVIFILETTGIDPDDYCVVSNACSLDDLSEIEPHRRKHLQSFMNIPRHKVEKRLGRPLKIKPPAKRDLAKSSGQNIIKVAHVTDIHVDLEYEEGCPQLCGFYTCCRCKYMGTGYARRYGDVGCNIPQVTVDIAFDFMREYGVDFVLYAGDTNPGAAWEETQEMQLEGSRVLAETAERLLADHGIPVYPAMGNHEMYPANLYWLGRQEIQEVNEEYAKYWNAAANFPEDQRDTLEWISAYTLELRKGLRLLTYNSNYGYTFNWYNLINLWLEDDFAEQLEWMDGVLEEARENGEKVVVMGHHPTGDDASFINYSYLIVDLLASYSDIIVLHVLGHFHRDHYKLIWEDKFENGGIPVLTQFIGTSLTTWRNPGFRIYDMDADTFEVLDFEQYFMNISRISDLPPITDHVTLLYRATHEYNMLDVSPESFRDLALRMNEDRDLLLKYVDNMHMHDGDYDCTNSTCQQNVLCDIWCPSWDANRACRESGVFPPPEYSPELL